MIKELIRTGELIPLRKFAELCGKRVGTIRNLVYFGKLKPAIHGQRGKDVRGIRSHLFTQDQIYEVRKRSDDPIVRGYKALEQGLTNAEASICLDMKPDEIRRIRSSWLKDTGSITLPRDIVRKICKVNVDGASVKKPTALEVYKLIRMLAVLAKKRPCAACSERPPKFCATCATDVKVVKR